MKDKIVSEINNSSVMKVVRRLEDKLIYMMMSAESISGKLPECFVVALYSVLHLAVGLVHEPWYDEAQAWQIARSASLWEIIFEIPHYEGHPQLWHLILVPFAKTGMPYELSLSIITLLITGSAVLLMVLYAPFPRVVKWLLPFTYFLFYQYGIVARPYCLMVLAFVLLALAYEKRMQEPWKYTLCLFLLCQTSAYGIVIAGGVAFLWLIECVGKRKNIWWLAGLLLAALLLMLTLVPGEDTYAVHSPLHGEAINSVWYRLYYMLFVSLPDVLLTNVFYEYSFLKHMQFSLYDGIWGGGVGLLLLGMIFIYGKRKKTVALFFVPFCLFAVSASVLYCTAHHIGITLLIFLFWWWISLGKPEKKLPWRGMVLPGALMLCVMLFWSGTAVVHEVRADFGVGRSMAEFIKEHHLDSYRIMTQWKCLYDDDGSLVASDTNMCLGACDVAPYFAHNLCYNFGEGADSENYVSHKIPTEEENEKRYETWKKQGYPDVLLMSPDIGLVWEAEELSYRDYVMVYFKTAEMPWKVNVSNSTGVIFVRKDLASKLGLKTVGSK